ncbi:YlbF/YmcA family competence regulator [Streptococcus ovuberis]|uniref:UPF0342 protein HF992_08010 n=1 Tax=Streptococcus ovuberis TaxID=1936207 RepID=A0A7X6MYI1_9STRE|nr:YlbF/YmcA family competence regulator [Streptococcus ovuberis]NKZ20772.1 YlbF/YmcA family competence regulator [Streptococcus ovuberis]
MSENIYDLANHLERAIRKLPEYEAVASAKKEIEQNPEAATLFKEYTDFQAELQGLMQTGQLPSQDLQDRMKELSQRLEANAIVSNYLVKQQQLSVYLSDIERIVFKPLQDLI